MMTELPMRLLPHRLRGGRRATCGVSPSRASCCCCCFCQVQLAFALAILLTFSSALAAAPRRQRPHIVVVTVDDVGVGDLSYSSADTISLPRIERLVKDGTVLTSMYAAPFAHASRVGLNTGRHPATLGNQHELYDATKPYGVSPDVPLLSKRLKDRDYVSHAIGQWDLGFYATNLVPTSRGFDTFYGSHLPYSSYDKHVGYDEAGNPGYDLHHNVTLDRNPPKLFKVDLYAEKAREVIAKHNKAEPLFLYVALQAARMYDIESDCAAVPGTYRPRSVRVGDKYRECFFAYLASVDHAFGKIVDALSDKTMLIDSVVLFLSLSSAAPGGGRRNSGSNAPLRGQRGTLFEGGLRVPCFLLAPYLSSAQPHYGGAMHVTDWYHTLQAIADYDPAAGPDDNRKALLTSESGDEMLSGRNQLGCLLARTECSPRQAMLHYAHGTSGALRNGDLKLIFDASGSMTSSQGEWYSPVAVSRPPNQQQHEPFYGITCNPHRAQGRETGSGCGAESRGYFLFNVVDDPCERHNLAPCGAHRADLLRLQEMLNASLAAHASMDLQPCSGASGQPAPPRTALIQSDHGWTPWVSSAPPHQRAASAIATAWRLVLTIMATAAGCCRTALMRNTDRMS